MKRVVGYIQTDKHGSRCDFEFEVEDDATPEQIEHEARETAFQYVEWLFEVKG
jgi:hypothetical protein